jgi:hypothetical protein
MNTTTAAHIDRSERHVGIDIGKCMLDVCIFELDIYLQYPNTTEGIRELTKKLSRYNLTRILIEATGGYERGLVEACAKKRIAGHHCAAYPGASICQSTRYQCQNGQDRFSSNRPIWRSDETRRQTVKQ